MVFDKETWNNLLPSDKKEIIRRILSDFKMEHSTLFVHTIFKSNIVESINEVLPLYQDFIISDLHKNSGYSIPKNNRHVILRDLYYTIDDTDTIHIIIDEYNKLYFINSNKINGIRSIITQLIYEGKILMEIPMDKNRDIFKLRFFRTYKYIGKEFELCEN